ncbi:CPBP family intramembrane metalloprotease [Heliobacterium gestii]|uniref:CPBP family intramembrane metalloprotease n=1 Tax=Heliomicrobium gestii TaxID=2699 RepID=A0A845LBE8_HELGE|nr:CPBP family intramembrane glutamic endopeptidase [Heliomicrobium gestii]MBM7867598.1 membrane protease YdiL (CAAX protease family) [Heliomicrobium gestii]MZP43992.1 CPBP family intramembrane metalloprotease [Heliomicrobium gestii]
MINLIFPAPPHPVEEFFRSSRSGPELPTLLLLLLAAGIFAPVAEECFFRGFFLPALARRWGWTRAIHGSAFVFAALHGDAYRFLPLYAAGCWLGRVVSRERTLLPAIVAHAVWNLIGLALLYLGMLYMGGIG